MLADFDRINVLKSPSIDDFEILDWKLIEFIGRHNSITKNQILKHFNGDETYITRLSRIRSIVYERENTALNENGTTGSTLTGEYYLGDLGKKLLKDYKTRNRVDFKNRLIVPVTVSVVTNLLIHGIKWLWPHLLKFLSDILSQTP